MLAEWHQSSPGECRVWGCHSDQSLAKVLDGQNLLMDLIISPSGRVCEIHHNTSPTVSNTWEPGGQ
uniref:Uncharacterized protein n=1 Tax=Romanomermis culicivorax TaxID=13658 RepID=A0A915J275_ROMCU